ncbi:ComEC/Rec2 family competence protein [Clostridium cellulovorans]|uniref:ComEC/Rec2 family competence protein n=1 Tax=Clostridium cellulovorans TaxID=1493 RepID=UPI002417D65B|nr:ComEC/Rec2 family competence protein [Clostridium cellulovorans]
MDVDQGDSILINYNGTSTLIDSGSEEYSSNVINYLKKEKIKSIDNLILTHPHEDHYGGMVPILMNFKAKNFYCPRMASNTEGFSDILYQLKKDHSSLKFLKAGDTFVINPDLKFFIVSPNRTCYDDGNNYSLVIKVVYKDTSFLLTGDATKTSEEEILAKGFNINSDVLKVGHHGSSTSTSEEFLSKVSPSLAIISVGKRNSYGHPSVSTINRLGKFKIPYLSTSKEGNIILISNGNTIYRKT